MEETFNFSKYLDEMQKSKTRHVRVTAVFLKKHRMVFGTPNFKNAAQVGVAIRRYARASKEVGVFDNEDILRAMDKAFERVGEEATVETVLKYLTK
jgi:hypothetical protein